MEEYTFRPSTDSLDDPPNSRLFLVTSKSIAEDVIREHFGIYGEIQDIWVVKDKQTKESKGVSFVKFAKSSQACKAMEEMHGKCLAEGTKPIKVFIAQSRASGSHRDVEDEELTRIFVMIPKTFTEEDLKETFKEFGDIEYCIIIKNKTTGESKGLGYVRYQRPSQAAMAIENCDKTFRAILAEPRNKSVSSENEYFGNSRADHGVNDPGMSAYPFDGSNYSIGDVRGADIITRCLMVSSRASITQEQFYGLFDLIPGMEYCEVQRDPYGFSKGQAMIRYNNLGSAIYAKEKLHGFEYPPGNRLAVSYMDDGEDRSSPMGKMAMQLVAAQMMSVVWSGPAGAQLMKSGVGYPPPAIPQIPRVQTDVALPPPKKMAPSDSRVKERLFVVFNPAPLPVDVLEDVFCRFGALLEVYLVPGRNVGYMKYAERKSATEAMAALHGKVVNGVKMKVMLADPPKEESHKRQRTY
ncbi:RNA-binding protein 45 [Brienomyrus brachyistius]|uniref:RNA-binding protein 45 n=1 Tax=Brienomyrus brachyistius TaxID=42636 RepID=UPI0020B1BB83|nr:RNA-binding protein 45 [Brienomyrus brachyistius]XP_048872587.1 RNA-binding protein 45 [Brienomyrus brachyistius]XP_048872597.1 RNA-binding protein 45 [Brienomyrus brachyistius]